jgi:hypothetical protein
MEKCTVSSTEFQHISGLLKSRTLSSNRTGCYFFPTAGKSNQKEPPLKNKKLKTDCARFPIAIGTKLLPLVVKQGKFFNAPYFRFLTLFLHRRNNATTSFNRKIRLKYQPFNWRPAFDPSGCVGRQNARRRVRFDKIFVSFSSIGKGRASPA